MKTRRLVLGLALLCSLLITSLAYAQAPSLNLSLSRDWGYGGFNDDIQGTFSFKVSGPADLVKVEFYIDATKIGEAAQAPFNLQFVTDEYPNGDHTLSARGTTASGKVLVSPPVAARFVAASEGSRAMLSFVVPILVLVFAAILISGFVSMSAGRKAGASHTFPLGGGLCPHCGSPVAFQFFSMNLLGSKFQRCPSCGKWGVTKRASLDVLRAAQQAEASSGQPQPSAESEADQMKKAIDDSKYQPLACISAPAPTPGITPQPLADGATVANDYQGKAYEGL